MGSGAALGGAGVALVAASWLSGALFAGYILIFYLGAPASGSIERWNRTPPKLYEAGHQPATVAIGANFAAGALLLLAEMFIRERRAGTAAGRWGAAGLLALATAIVLVGTWYFAVDYWLPGIMGRA